MIDNLRDLNEKVNAFVNYVVKTACEETTSGQYYVSVDDACKAAGMGYDDFLEYKDIIMNEFLSRDEVLDFDYRGRDEDLDIDCALNYCPNYEWCDGDEEIFGSYEDFEERKILPVSQRLSLPQMADIGMKALQYIVAVEDRSIADVAKDALGLSDSDVAGVLVEDEVRTKAYLFSLSSADKQQDDVGYYKDLIDEIDKNCTKNKLNTLIASANEQKSSSLKENTNVDFTQEM